MKIDERLHVTERLLICECGRREWEFSPELSMSRDCPTCGTTMTSAEQERSYDCNGSMALAMKGMPYRTEYEGRHGVLGGKVIKSQTEEEQN